MATRQPQFKSAYDRSMYIDRGLDFPQDDVNSMSMTQQHYKDDADINLMIKKYGIDRVVEGDPLNPGSVTPKFDDFTNFPDYHTMNNQIIAVNEAFMQLDAEVRAEFNNDPAELLAFIQDTNNRKEAEEKGLLLDEAAAKAETAKSELKEVDQATETPTI